MNSCKECKNPSARYRCSRCHAVSYCNVICQRKDWQEHKQTCRLLPPDDWKSCIIMFDLSPRPSVLEELEAKIRTCLANPKGLTLVVHTSYGSDDPQKELCEYPILNDLYYRACTEKGLYTFIVLQSDRPNTLDYLKQNDAFSVACIATGAWTRNKDFEKNECEYLIDDVKFQDMVQKSQASFDRLYGKK